MTINDEREKSEERKFAMDEQSQFNARMRRDRFIGHWAAEKLGLFGAEATAYAKSMVNLDLEQHTDAAILARIKSDLAAKNVAVSDADISAMMEQKMAEAVAQLKAGQK